MLRSDVQRKGSALHLTFSQAPMRVTKCEEPSREWVRGRQALICPVDNIQSLLMSIVPFGVNSFILCPTIRLKFPSHFLSKTMVSRWRFYKASCWRREEGPLIHAGPSLLVAAVWLARLALPHKGRIVKGAVGWLAKTASSPFLC